MERSFMLVIKSYARLIVEVVWAKYLPFGDSGRESLTIIIFTLVKKCIVIEVEKCLRLKSLPSHQRILFIFLAHKVYHSYI